MDLFLQYKGITAVYVKFGRFYLEDERVCPNLSINFLGLSDLRGFGVKCNAYGGERGRIKAAGEWAGVKVTPHQLRHILRQTQHRLYARIHDHTVTEDYQIAMTVIEQRLEDCLTLPAAQTTNQNNGRPQTEQQLLTLVDALAGDNLDQTQQAVLAELRQGLLALAT
jgi:hypothetical protein